MVLTFTAVLKKDRPPVKGAGPVDIKYCRLMADVFKHKDTTIFKSAILVLSLYKPKNTTHHEHHPSPLNPQ